MKYLEEASAFVKKVTRKQRLQEKLKYENEFANVNIDISMMQKNFSFP